ncbi:unnamed protein product [Macrosiphum euphorbiae]|uniref:Uncharacterized protein n=1 Tax=Macrosiphum euphorbiae TaxID=13131 RepID=A0AAV0Y9T1_9HEMI|nr:unnamed protein product [Macrosiphum euphorbiae]
MGKVNNLPSAPPPPSLLADIIQARMNIKKKYSALKTGRFETESLVNNTLGSIIDPLNKIRDNIGTLRTHSSVHQPQSPPTSPTTTPHHTTPHHTTPPHHHPQHRRRDSQHNDRYRMSIKNIPPPHNHHHRHYHHRRRLLHNTI